MGQSVLRDRRNPFRTTQIFNEFNSRSVPMTRKGIGLIFPNLDTEIVSSDTSAVTQTNSETSAGALGRVVFSL
jgi:hypothetical protein